MQLVYKHNNFSNRKHHTTTKANPHTGLDTIAPKHRCLNVQIKSCSSNKEIENMDLSDDISHTFTSFLERHNH